MAQILLDCALEYLSHIHLCDAAVVCKTALPCLVRGEYGSNTPQLCFGVFEPYSPLQRGGFTLIFAPMFVSLSTP